VRRERGGSNIRIMQTQYRFEGKGREKKECVPDSNEGNQPRLSPRLRFCELRGGEKEKKEVHNTEEKEGNVAASHGLLVHALSSD